MEPTEIVKLQWSVFPDVLVDGALDGLPGHTVTINGVEGDIVHAERVGEHGVAIEVAVPEGTMPAEARLAGLSIAGPDD